MTSEQFLAILGTIYISPHLPPMQCKITGAILLIAAVCKGLGWI